MRIDMILQNSNPFGYAAYTASKMKAALEKEGVKVGVVSLEEGTLQKYMEYAKEYPPIGLITYEGTLSKSVHFQKLLNCQELFIAEHALTPIAHFLGQSNTIIGLPDRNLARYAKGYFFPQPVEGRFNRKSLSRPIKIATFASLIDMSRLHSIWRELFSKKVCEAMMNWSMLFKERSHIHPLQQMLSLPAETIALCTQTSGHDLVLATTQYLEASKIRPLVEAFNSLPIHLFGNHFGRNLYATLPNPENVYLHALPPYKQVLNLLEEIEIVVMEPLESIDGPPEYFFHALQQGALPLTPPSPFLEELFGKEAALFYRSHEELIEKCHLYLNDSKKRSLLVDELRQIDMKPFSWKKAAELSLAIFRSKSSTECF
jgi:hypothetical protein